jgi:hypothetical protein
MQHVERIRSLRMWESMSKWVWYAAIGLVLAPGCSGSNSTLAPIRLAPDFAIKTVRETAPWTAECIQRLDPEAPELTEAAQVALSAIPHPEEGYRLVAVYGKYSERGNLEYLVFETPGDFFHTDYIVVEYDASTRMILRCYPVARTPWTKTLISGDGINLVRPTDCTTRSSGDTLQISEIGMSGGGTILSSRLSSAHTSRT